MKSTMSFRFLVISRVLLAGLALSGAATPEMCAADFEFPVDTESDTHDFDLRDEKCSDETGSCSLRAAIEQSNALFPSVTLIDLPSGTYKLTLGELQINASLQLSGAGSDITFIIGNLESRIFHISNTRTNPTVNMDGVTILNGNASAFGTGNGGGILIEPGSTLTLAGSAVSLNKGRLEGAGISNGGSLVIESCTIDGNRITQPVDGVTGLGGGIYNFGSGIVKISHSTINNNYATTGGGGIANDGLLEMSNSTVSGNSVFAGGGGILNRGSARITFSTITENKANVGTRVNTTERTAGGGIRNERTVEMGNTIVAGNTDCRADPNFPQFDCLGPPVSSDGFSQAPSTVISKGGNLVGVIDKFNLELTSSDQKGTRAEPLDAQLFSLAQNGGPTLTHALKPDSPAIDKGTGMGSGDTFFDCPETDQRGEARPVGMGCDVGAFEFSAKWKADPLSGDWNNAANWTLFYAPNGPNDIATFGVSNRTDVSLSVSTEVQGIVFNPGASSFTITCPVTQIPPNTLTISGAGITNNSGVAQNFVTTVDQSNGGTISFRQNATAGEGTVFTNQGGAVFGGVGGVTRFESGGGGNVTSAGNGTFINNGGAVSSAFGGSTFLAGADGANGTFINKGGAVSGAFGGSTSVVVASAGNGTFTNNGGEVSGAFGGITDVSGVTDVTGSAGTATFTSEGGAVMGAFGGITEFSANSHANSATLKASGDLGPIEGGLIRFRADSTGDTAQVEVLDNGSLDISLHDTPGVTIGSIKGNGLVFLGANELGVGSNNHDTTFAGRIQDGGAGGGIGGSLTKIGNGRLFLTNDNTYTGGTTIAEGKLVIDNTSGSGTGRALCR